MALAFSLQSRDRKTGKIRIDKQSYDPAHLAVVIVDLWNWHWCKTASERVAAIVPRMNRALECLRKLGVRIIHCPTDGAAKFVGTRPREAAVAVPKHPLPEIVHKECPPPPGGACMCGPGIECPMNFGWNGMCDELIVDEDDFIAFGAEELFSICTEYGYSDLIYMGVHTNACVLARPEGMGSMVGRGLRGMLVRDITDAQTWYDPATGYTPDDGTADVVAHLERHFCPTIHIVDELRKQGVWQDDWITEPVRFSPWGVRERPHEFEESVTVTLTIPWLDGAEVRYTLDGSEPTLESKLYSKPFRLMQTTIVTAAAFRNGERVSFVNAGYFYHLGAKPPKPDVHLSGLEPLEATTPDYRPNNPKPDRSCARTRLKLRGINYARGMGVHAPSHLVYPLKPEYERFVARVGVDEACMVDCYALGVGRELQVVFRVFIDGELAAQSPVMRLQQEPWRFDIEIPRGSRVISLAAVPDGTCNCHDLADWVDAGFVVKKDQRGRE